LWFGTVCGAAGTSKGNKVLDVRAVRAEAEDVAKSVGASVWVHTVKRSPADCQAALWLETAERANPEGSKISVVRPARANGEDGALKPGAAGLRHAVKAWCAERQAAVRVGTACRAAAAGKSNKTLEVRTARAKAEDGAITHAAPRRHSVKRCAAQRQTATWVATACRAPLPVKETRFW